MIKSNLDFIKQIITIEECASRRLAIQNVYKSLDTLLKAGGQIDLIVLNGFFAGANLVPEEHVLDKFKGRMTCRSYNPGLDFGAAEYIAANCPILAVSKNVCHHPDNVINKWHENYNCKPTKKLHDLLMAKEGLNYLDKAPMLCEYKEVRIFREGIEWGAEESEGANVVMCIYKK